MYGDVDTKNNVDILRLLQTLLDEIVMLFRTIDITNK